MFVRSTDTRYRIKNVLAFRNLRQLCTTTLGCNVYSGLNFGPKSFGPLRVKSLLPTCKNDVQISVAVDLKPMAKLRHMLSKIDILACS